MNPIYDIIVVGAGPAGLTAAIYARRAGKTVLVLEKSTFGGQITFSPKVENIPGFLSLTGNEFAEKLVDQAISQGAELSFCEVLSVRDGDVKTVVTDDGEYSARAVILAVGTKHRLLGLPKEETFIGNGISFCAVCDGAFYKDKNVAVVGGGNSALQEALQLSELAAKVTVVQNLDFLTGEARLVEQIGEKDNIEVILGTVVRALVGEETLAGIELLRPSDGETRTLPLDGLFVAIGLVPQNEAFANVLPLDARGYVDTDEACKTTTPGIFVAGDCRKKSIRQLTTAFGDGAVAALAAVDFVNGR